MKVLISQKCSQLTAQANWLLPLYFTPNEAYRAEGEVGKANYFVAMMLTAMSVCTFHSHPLLSSLFSNPSRSMSPLRVWE